MKVKCPGCGLPAVFDAKENPFRPFCSERCKLIDLGAWADGTYSIPVAAPPTEEELEEILAESSLADAIGAADDDESSEDPRH